MFLGSAVGNCKTILAREPQGIKSKALCCFRFQGTWPEGIGDRPYKARTVKTAKLQEISLVAGPSGFTIQRELCRAVSPTMTTPTVAGARIR